MRNLGFPETISPGTFFTPSHQETKKVGAFSAETHRLAHNQWQRLMEIQQIQMELTEELAHKKRPERTE